MIESAPDPDTHEALLSLPGVSYETIHRLQRYAALLADWSQRMNLVAPGALAELWPRHILDSAQLVPLIPAEARSLADVGSGAGFPGLVLAIAQDRPVHLIESIGKKASFLRAVAEALQLDHVTIHQARAETLTTLKADLVTARAVAPLGTLLGFVKPLMRPSSVALLLKGAKATDELTDSRKYWTFKAETIPSRTDPSGLIVRIEALAAHDRTHRPRRRPG